MEEFILELKTRLQEIDQLVFGWHISEEEELVLLGRKSCGCIIELDRISLEDFDFDNSYIKTIKKIFSDMIHANSEFLSEEFEYIKEMEDLVYSCVECDENILDVDLDFFDEIDSFANLNCDRMCFSCENMNTCTESSFSLDYID